MNKKKLLYFILAITITISSLLGFNTRNMAMESDEENIRVIIESYMSGRLKVLSGDGTLELAGVAVVGIVNDELSHKETLEEENISIFYSEYEIESINISDRDIYVSVLETVTYINNRVTETKEIEHKILMMDSSTRGLVVLSDKYYEEISDFASCAYVPEVTTYGLARSSTYSLEIVNIAAGEDGYVEKETNANLYDKTANAGDKNYTKYGAWYGCNGQPWCAMFVSWCANQAGVSTCIVPKYASCDDGLEKFDERSVFYKGPVYGITFTPQEGDIFFIGVIGDATHTGIVASVNSSTKTMVVIDGNYGDQVTKRTMSFKDSSLLGFARPRYSASHMYILKYNTSYHWNACSVCGTTTPKQVHMYSSLGKCTLCGATNVATASLSVNNLKE